MKLLQALNLLMVLNNRKQKINIQITNPYRSVWVFYLDKDHTQNKLITKINSLFDSKPIFVIYSSLRSGIMKIILLLTLFFPSLLLANQITFCDTDGNSLSVAIKGKKFALTVNDVVNNFTIKKNSRITGTEAQVDAHLIGEAIDRSDVYKLGTDESEEAYMALVKGVSGNIHLIELLTTTTLGTTAECKN